MSRMTHKPTFYAMDVEELRKDVEPGMIWVKLHNGRQYRLTPYEHVLLITRGEVYL